MKLPPLRALVTLATRRSHSAAAAPSAAPAPLGEEGAAVATARAALMLLPLGRTTMGASGIGILAFLPTWNSDLSRCAMVEVGILCWMDPEQQKSVSFRSLFARAFALFRTVCAW